MASFSVTVSGTVVRGTDADDAFNIIGAQSVYLLGLGGAEDRFTGPSTHNVLNGGADDSADRILVQGGGQNSERWRPATRWPQRSLTRRAIHKAISGLCSIPFLAIAAAAADKNPIAKDQRKLEALLSIRSGEPEKKLFFGSVEFDCDPDAPGGVPGFGPLPHAASQVAVAKSEQVNTPVEPEGEPRWR